MYATSGGSWVHANRITYSFVPDGTNVGGTSSNLFATLNASFPTATWQSQFRRAATVWQAVSNINMVEVADDGTAIGASGMQQGDSRFGDIRIGGMTQAAGQVGMSWATPPFNGGTLAGDVFLNTSKDWSGGINSYDIQTLAIHEIGHALGMSHSSISNASMYYYYMGTDTSLLSDDIAGIRAIYNTRQPDAYDVVGSGNYNTATATPLPEPDARGQILIPGLDIAGAADVDWFKLVVPAATTGSMTITMQSTNLSSLSPRFQIFNGAGRTITAATTAAVTDYGATISQTMGGLVAGQTYYVRTSGSSSGVSGAGGYGLQVNFGSAPQSPIPPAVTTVPEAPDQLWGANPLSVVPGIKSTGRGRGHKPHGETDEEYLTFGNLAGRGVTLTVGQLRNSKAELEQFAHRRRTVTSAWLFVEPVADDDRDGSASRNSDHSAEPSRLD